MEHNDEAPKIFWKYYDLFRRGLITIDEYSYKTSLKKDVLLWYITNVTENENNR